MKRENEEDNNKRMIKDKIQKRAGKIMGKVGKKDKGRNEYKKRREEEGWKENEKDIMKK
jgi:hypothetical protein